jgi:hypothetical protein
MLIDAHPFFTQVGIDIGRTGNQTQQVTCKSLGKQSCQPASAQKIGKIVIEFQYTEPDPSPVSIWPLLLPDETFALVASNLWAQDAKREAASWRSDLTGPLELLPESSTHTVTLGGQKVEQDVMSPSFPAKIPTLSGGLPSTVITSVEMTPKSGGPFLRMPRNSEPRAIRIEFSEWLGLPAASWGPFLDFGIGFEW